MVQAADVSDIHSGCWVETKCRKDKSAPKETREEALALGMGRRIRVTL